MGSPSSIREAGETRRMPPCPTFRFVQALNMLDGSQPPRGEGTASRVHQGTCQSHPETARNHPETMVNLGTLWPIQVDP